MTLVVKKMLANTLKELMNEKAADEDYCTGFNEEMRD